MIAVELATRRAQGESTYALARAYGLDWHTVRDILTAMGVQRGGRRVLQAVSDAAHCRRCEILLAEAPAGTGGLCGWCRTEVVDGSNLAGAVLPETAVRDGHLVEPRCAEVRPRMIWEVT